MFGGLSIFRLTPCSVRSGRHGVNGTSKMAGGWQIRVSLTDAVDMEFSQTLQSGVCDVYVSV